MEPIHGPAGELIAWRFRDTLYDGTGQVAGFVRDHGVYTAAGACRGWFEDGVYRDRGGAIIGYEDEATGGFLFPSPQRPPVPPLPTLPGSVPSFETPVRPRFRKMAWGPRTLVELLGAGREPVRRKPA